MLMRAAAIVLMLPALSLAWGGEGHQVVALIAYQHLTPEAKAGTKALLGEGKDVYDGEVANWADRIRRENPSSGPYHYIDADVNQKTIDLPRDGKGGKNVVEGIDKYAAILADMSAKTQDREQALRWVIHLVGDVHQPLHCCDRNDDKGGNAVAVLFRDTKKPTNLHSVWDTPMLRSYIGSKDITDYATAIDHKAKPADVAAWQTGKPLDWANETHAVAVRDVYGDLPAGDPVKIDAKYVTKKQPVIEGQLERGGVRLAAVLNKAFASGATTRPVR